MGFLQVAWMRPGRFPIGCGSRWRDSYEMEDPYRFPPLLGELDIHLLAEGTHRQAYRKLGAHPVSHRRCQWRRLCRLGAECSPRQRHRPVQSIGTVGAIPCGSIRLAACGKSSFPALTQGRTYKYEIKSSAGDLQPLKADPFAFCAERPPATASIVYRSRTIAGRTVRGSNSALRRCSARNAPIAIYEVHLGSWRRRLDRGRPLSQLPRACR